MPDTDDQWWRPGRMVHPLVCECAGEGLLPSETVDRRGETYNVWRQCPGTRHRMVPNPGPTKGLSEYLETHPNWLDQPYDENDHRFARNTARALIRDPGAIVFPAGNPLAPLVAHYLAEYRKAR